MPQVTTLTQLHAIVQYCTPTTPGQHLEGTDNACCHACQNVIVKQSLSVVIWKQLAN